MGVTGGGAGVARIAAAIQARGGCQFPMHIGDSHLPAPARFTDALAASLHDPRVYRYSAPDGRPSLREALAARRSQAVGRAVPVERVIVTAGATEATHAVIRVCMQPGESALVLSPSWPLFRGQLAQHGVRAIEVPFFRQGVAPAAAGVDALLGSFRQPSTRLLYLASPNNPDGGVIAPDVMLALLEFAERHDLWVLSDEVYENQCYDGEAVSAGAFASRAERVVTVHSFSKLFGLAGVRLGYLTVPAAIGQAVRAILQHTIYCPPELLQRGCEAALDDGAFLREQRSAFLHARATTAAALGVAAPAGGVYHFLDTGRDADGVAMELLDEADVAATPGGLFGGGYGSWLRLCFTALPAEMAAEGARRVAAHLERAAPPHGAMAAGVPARG